MVALVALAVSAVAGGQMIPVGAASMAGDVTSGLITEWRFDNGPGDILVDYIGSNNGELGSAGGGDANDCDWVAQGCDFIQANGDRIRIPFFQDVTGAWTLIVVAEVTAAEGTGRTVFSQEDGTGTGRTWLNINAIDEVQSNIGGVALDDGVITTGFHSYTVSHASGTVNVYLDGGSKSTGSRTAEAATGQHKFGITKTDTNGYNGIIAWGRMYNRQLSDTEVLQVHNWLKANIGRGIVLALAQPPLPSITDCGVLASSLWSMTNVSEPFDDVATNTQLGGACNVFSSQHPARS